MRRDADVDDSRIVASSPTAISFRDVATPFESLLQCDDLVLLILSYLSYRDLVRRLNRVCRHFTHLVQSGSIPALSIQGAQRINGKRTLFGSTGNALSASSSYSITDSSMLSTRQRRLRDQNSRRVMHVLHSYRCLTVLRLESVNMRIDSSFTRMLFLQETDSNGNRGILSQLHTLYLSNVEWSKPLQGIDTKTSQEERSIALDSSAHHALRKFHIGQMGREVDDVLIHWMLDRLPHLLSLTLDQCQGIQKLAIDGIKHPRLAELRLLGCESLTEISFPQRMDSLKLLHLQNLCRLDMDSFDLFLAQYADIRLRYLQELRFSCMRAPLRFLGAESGNVLRNLKFLRSLFLNNISVTSDDDDDDDDEADNNDQQINVQISHEGLQNFEFLFMSNPRLNSFRLHGCFRLQHVSIIESNGCNGLETLRIENSTIAGSLHIQTRGKTKLALQNVTFGPMFNLMANVKLTEILLENLAGFQQPQLGALLSGIKYAERVGDLRRLRIKSCNKIKALDLGPMCTNVREVNIVDCSRLEHLAIAWPGKLQRLSLERCPMLSNIFMDRPSTPIPDKTIKMIDPMCMYRPYHMHSIT